MMYFKSIYCKFSLASKTCITYHVRGCGSSSVVEYNLAKVRAEGSNPFSRSKFFILSRQFCRTGVSSSWRSVETMFCLYIE